MRKLCLKCVFILRMLKRANGKKRIFPLVVLKAFMLENCPFVCVCWDAVVYLNTCGLENRVSSCLSARCPIS